MQIASLVAALVLALAVVARFPPLLLRFPFDGLVFALAGAALGVVVVAESRLVRGTVGPLWMQVKFAPRLALAIGLSFWTTVIAQMLQVSLGPVDVAFPGTAPLGINAVWFFVFTLGFSGIGMMSAPSIFLPVLTPPARLLRKVPAAVAFAIFALVGAGVGFGLSRLFILPVVVNVITQGRTWVDANSQLVFAITLALTVGPALIPSRPEKSDD